MIGYRNASYGAMVLCDNLEGQIGSGKCCGFLIEAMERKLRNRGSLCWTRFPLSEVPRNGLPKGSRSTFYIHFVGLTSTNFYTLKVEWWGGNENECKWEFQRQSDGEEKGDFYWMPYFCSRSDCRNPAHGFRRGKGFREEHPLRG